MCASIVSAPTFSARMTRLPVPFTVPPMTLSPRLFSTGIDSPVTIDSSTALRPSSTTPSTGTLLARAHAQPVADLHLLERHFLVAPPSSSRRAVFGARLSRARMAPPVCSRARSSSTWPSSTSTVMTAAASK